MSLIALIKSLGLNVALLISLTAIYRQTLIHGNKLHSTQAAIINGILFGAVGIAGMLVPLEVTPGVIIDGRVVVVALSGAFTGGLSTAIATGVVSAYRIYLGGIGTLPGVGAIIIGASLGILFYYKFRQSIKVLHLFVLGLLLALEGLLWTLTLPTESRFVLFGIYWLPVTVAYPAGTVFLGLLLLNENRQFTLEQALQKNEKRLASQLSEQEALLKISHAILEMKQPNDLYQVAQASLAALRDLNINAQSLAIHRIQDADQQLILALRVLTDRVIKNLDVYQAEPGFLDVWKTKTLRYRPNIAQTNVIEFQNLQKRFDGLTIKSHIDVPFLQGILCIHSTQVDAFSEHDIEILQKIAEMLSVGLARVEDLEKLEQRSADLEKEISERTRVEQELVRTQRLRAAGELSAGISHNLNNILTGILGPAMLLELMDLTKEAREQVSNILSAGNRAKDIVSRLHQTTRGAQQDLAQAVDINSIIEEAIQITKPRWQDEANAKGISFDIQKNLADVPPVTGTPAGFLDIMINLLFNAIDASPQGGHITITTAKSDDKYIRVTVQDTGVGMDAETLSRIFEPFFTTKAHIGTGLGLSTAYNTIQKYGGSIEVTSQPKQGTTFTIQLVPWSEPENIKK